jgi:hypothetical protein
VEIYDKVKVKTKLSGKGKIALPDTAWWLKLVGSNIPTWIMLNHP